MTTNDLEYDSDWFIQYRQSVNRGEEPTHMDITAQTLRENIIVSNLYLCKRVVGKMKKSMPAHVERDDLESWAKIGLLQAVTRFDSSLGVPFEAYATQRMRSVIMDGIRDADWAPRSLRKKQRDINKIEENFRQTEGRDPSAQELAYFLTRQEFLESEDSWTPEDFAERVDELLVEISNTKYQSEISAHTYIEGNLEAQNKPASLNAEEDDLVFVLKATVGKALEDLPIREAAIIALHYYSEKKLSDIASALNMSEVKVGILHSDAVIQIWQRIQSVLKDA